MQLAEKWGPPDFKVKLTELSGFLHSDDTPLGVKEACYSLTERQKELFAWMPGDFGPVRNDPFYGMYATKFLNELLCAFRANDWDKVISLMQAPRCHVGQTEV